METFDQAVATAAFLDRCPACVRDLRLPRNVGTSLMEEAARRPYLRLERLEVRVGHGTVQSACDLLASPSCAALRALCFTVACSHRVCHARVIRAVPYASLARLRVFFGDISGEALRDLAQLLSRAPGLRRLALENVAVAPEDLVRVLPRTLVSLTIRGECIPAAPLVQSLDRAPDLRSIVLRSERLRVDEGAAVRLMCLAAVSFAVESRLAVDCVRVIALLNALSPSVRTCSKAYIVCSAHGPRGWCGAIQEALSARRVSCSITLTGEVARFLPVAELPELVAAFLQQENLPPTESEAPTQTYTQ
jgi:hypothetical protein